MNIVCVCGKRFCYAVILLTTDKWTIRLSVVTSRAQTMPEIPKASVMLLSVSFLASLNSFYFFVISLGETVMLCEAMLICQIFFKVQNKDFIEHFVC